MATFVEKLNDDIKQAMRDKRKEDLSILRMLLSALKNKKIDLGNKDELTDEEAQAVVKSEVKKRKDAIVSYKDGDREDLAEIEQREIELLANYMPEQMSEKDIVKIVTEVIAGIPDADQSKFGQIMGMAMQKTKGQADGQMVGAIVKELLSK
jgi:uncharacterized protein YqeY